MIGELKRCGHGIIAHLCVLCESHKKAVSRISRQPFFDRPDIDTPFDKASRYAVEMLTKTLSDKLNNTFIWCSPRLRIRRQPFFGVDKSEPVTIKFRRPIPYEVSETAAKGVDDAFAEIVARRNEDIGFYWGNGKA